MRHTRSPRRAFQDKKWFIVFLPLLGLERHVWLDDQEAAGVPKPRITQTTKLMTLDWGSDVLGRDVSMRLELMTPLRLRCVRHPNRSPADVQLLLVIPGSADDSADRVYSPPVLSGETPTVNRSD